MLAFLVFGLVACGDDSTGLEDIAGTYTLQTVEGGGFPRFLKKPKPLSSSRLQEGV